MKPSKPLANPSSDYGQPFRARAALAGYIVLNAPAILGVLIFIVGILIRGITYRAVWDALLAWILYATIWTVWLKGFQLNIENGIVTYRNGLYRSHSIHLKDIEKTEFKWVDWRCLSRKLKVPRLVVYSNKDNDHLIINPKPFSQKDLKEFRVRCNQKL